MAPRTSARDIILDAAEALVRDSGAAHLTLDAVAQRARVSKGGLLYHFRSKEALLRGMVERQLQRFQADLASAEERLPRSKNRELQAYVAAAAGDTPQNKQMCAALIAATANNPELLGPVREFHRRHLEMVRETDLGFEKAAVLWLATNGLWFLEMLQISPLTAVQRRRITAALALMAGGDA